MAVTSMPKVSLSRSAEMVLEEAKSVRFVGSVEELVQLAVPDQQTDTHGYFTVGYDVAERGFVAEMKICRVRKEWPSTGGSWRSPL